MGRVIAELQKWNLPRTHFVSEGRTGGVLLQTIPESKVSPASSSIAAYNISWVHYPEGSGGDIHIEEAA